jgi:ferric-dicitrate binding protein FerR (iron transport regulator)
VTSHSPKTAALMAYESGALSSVGRARVERHLAGCTVCQRELAVIQTYEATVDRIRDAKAPDLDWSRMELALEREARTQAKKHQRGWVMPAIGVMLAAAAAVALVIAPGTNHSTPLGVAAHHVDSSPPTSIAIAPEPSALEADVYGGARITLVASESTVRDASGQALPLHLGDVVSDGTTIATTTGSVHARLADGLAVALEPSTTLRLATHDGAPELTLAQGRVFADVHRRSEVHEARTIILAGAYRIEVEVASFVFDLDANGALRIDVHSGEVHVSGEGTDETLTAPARFPADAAVLDATTPVGSTDGYDAMPTLHVARPGIVRWQIGDLALSGAGELAMRVGTGPMTITGWDAHDRIYRTSVIMTAEGLDLAPDELTPEAPRIHAGTLSREEITPVIRQHQAELTRCFERQLRTSTLEARVTASISLDMTGTVQSVDFGGDPIPAEMARCMSDRIGAWIFPPPHGGPFTFSVPFNFGH